MSYIQEEWKPVVGYENLYEVSSDGRILSKQPRWNAPRIIRQSIKRRYSTAPLTKGGKTRHLLVHRLVMAAFVGHCPLGHEVNHKDGASTNNRLDNLEYITKAENYAHALDHGLYERGEYRYNAKLTESAVVEIKAMRGKMTGAALAQRHGVSRSCVSRVQLGKGWNHVG
jgi:hypothetical protein